ncbi:glycosyltransferase family 2 protein [Gluconobacter wancherniae]|uniref:glycosyltransferase family 2 protein n=1 Tax=Gluconobacter wancherniae TaxID=1307955 RepID=UPI001B8D1232|nr:glycosyltransferase family 2 protein [Gluconobacter wancherniae]MBS1089975.1 glycosyltransferase family 2 protein [Gluconobacter wancherniae]
MIVIPMAGLSSRFTKAGYTTPKYMLPLAGKSVFAHSIESFSTYFEVMPFVFIARSVADTEAFIRKEAGQLGIKDVRIIILDHETSGQAETVELGVKKACLGLETPLTIFNIDTFRKKFRFPDKPWFKKSDGYLEVFKGEGDNWSYVGAEENSSEPLAARTTEKQPISDLCCDGLYHFAHTRDFLEALAQERLNPSSPELYVAPLYNHLIKDGHKIHYDLVPQDLITFCGVPAEYTALLNALKD